MRCIDTLIVFLFQMIIKLNNIYSDLYQESD